MVLVPYTLQMFVRPIWSFSIQMQRRESSRAPMQARATPPSSRSRTGQGWSAGARRRPERACSLRQGTNTGTVCFNALTCFLGLLTAQLVCSRPKVEKQSNGGNKLSTPVLLVLQPGSFDSSSQYFCLLYFQALLHRHRPARQRITPSR